MYQAGDAVAARSLHTITGESVRLPAPHGLTHLQFRRFAGCPICNVHLRTIARRHTEITAAGITEIAVFHSPADDMLPHQGGFPFAAIADPSRVLYREFGVSSSAFALTHPRAFSSPFKPQIWSVMIDSFRAGSSPFPKGETIKGLPAEFLINPAGVIQAAKYGRHASDHWSVDELLELSGA